MKRIAEASPLFKARIAGAVFVLGLLSAVLGEFFVRKLEIAADLIAVSCMIAVTLLLYGIFKPVNRGLSLIAASFNLAGSPLGLFDGILGAWIFPSYLTGSIAS
jgi:hypothetical protein